jgi:hypothetical protein
MTNQSEPQGIFYAADLPLNWTALSRLQPVQLEQWQHDSVSLLRALAVIEAPVAETDRDISSVAGKSMERLEAKLDLALSLMMQLARQQSELPAPHPVTLRSNSVEWVGASAPEPAQLILLSLHLSPKLPQALRIPATVAAVERLENGARVHANFTHLSPEVEDWLERTLFRFHRRSIQQSHSRQHDAS